MSPHIIGRTLNCFLIRPNRLLKPLRHLEGVPKMKVVKDQTERIKSDCFLEQRNGGEKESVIIFLICIPFSKNESSGRLNWKN